MAFSRDTIKSQTPLNTPYISDTSSIIFKLTSKLVQSLKNYLSLKIEKSNEKLLYFLQYYYDKWKRRMLCKLVKKIGWCRYFTKNYSRKWFARFRCIYIGIRPDINHKTILKLMIHTKATNARFMGFSRIDRIAICDALLERNKIGQFLKRMDKGWWAITSVQEARIDAEKDFALCVKLEENCSSWANSSWLDE